MAKRLTDNINSLYFEAANKMTSKKARRKIVAYVESYDDVFFWRSVLGKFEDETRYFEIMLPTRNHHLDRGKKAAIGNMLKGVGRDMIACVDADYDYLRQGTTEASQQMLENPYIFHTYAYAIENFQCYAKGLHETCVMVTFNDHRISSISKAFPGGLFPYHMAPLRVASCFSISVIARCRCILIWQSLTRSSCCHRSRIQDPQRAIRLSCQEGEGEAFQLERRFKKFKDELPDMDPVSE